MCGLIYAYRGLLIQNHYCDLLGKSRIRMVTQISWDEIKKFDNYIQYQRTIVI
jgi:hypothetical protein